MPRVDEALASSQAKSLRKYFKQFETIRELSPPLATALRIEQTPELADDKWQTLWGGLSEDRWRECLMTQACAVAASAARRDERDSEKKAKVVQLAQRVISTTLNVKLSECWERFLTAGVALSSKPEEATVSVKIEVAGEH